MKTSCGTDHTAHRSIAYHTDLTQPAGFLQGFAGLSTAGIITTNYDMVVEYALGTKGFNYGDINQILTGRGPYPVSIWLNPVRLTGKTKPAKIHGSIS